MALLIFITCLEQTHRLIDSNDYKWWKSYQDGPVYNNFALELIKRGNTRNDKDRNMGCLAMKWTSQNESSGEAKFVFKNFPWNHFASISYINKKRENKIWNFNFSFLATSLGLKLCRTSCGHFWNARIRWRSPLHCHFLLGEGSLESLGWDYDKIWIILLKNEEQEKENSWGGLKQLEKSQELCKKMFTCLGKNNLWFSSNSQDHWNLKVGVFCYNLFFVAIKSSF